ncbi:MAG TPA: hypothetical protein VFO25_08685 [Candidatus Eremiobacteraceae bacterium]|nr:hypothetical protein [Candidatus Eremiobacteraceae bacterium]
MRPSIILTSFAALAAALALTLAGCKYSSLGSPLPGPGGPPTLQPGVVSEKPIPTSNATPLGITSGPDGNVWFTELNGNKIGHVIPGTFPGAGSMVECGPLPTAGSGPVDITSVTGNPKVWFDEFANNKIANVDPGTCTYNEFTIPTSNSGPSGLTSDQSGVLWFAESNVAKIARMTIGGSFTEYATGLSGSTPLAVAIAGDNSVWYLDSGRNSVGHLTFPGGAPTFVDYGIPTNPSDPAYITLGPDGALWFTELGIGSLTGCQIGRITTGASPSITEYLMEFQPQPAPDGDVCLGITSAGGNIWFGEADSGAIGRVTPSGVVTEYGIPGSGTTAVYLTAGPDGNVWFTDGGFDPNVTIGTNQIGRVKVGMIPALSTARTFKATISTHRLPLLNAKGEVIRRVNGRPINP